jgi:hypothetical protein
MTISADQREVPREIQKTNGASGSLPPNRLLVFVLPAILVMMMTSAQVCHSQDSTPPSSKDAQGQKRNDSSTQPSGHERMFGIVPAYGLVEAGAQPPPLTSGQKFGLAVQYFNPYTFVFIAAEAGFNQALDSPKEFGQGAEGYGKRYGAGFADGLTAASPVSSVSLRQIPATRLGDGNWSHRTETTN